MNVAKMHLLLHITNLVSVQLNHYQFLFLMRLLETVSEITTFLTQDVSYILGESDESSMALGLIGTFSISVMTFFFGHKHKKI